MAIFLLLFFFRDATETGHIRSPFCSFYLASVKEKQDSQKLAKISRKVSVSIQLKDESGRSHGASFNLVKTGRLNDTLGYEIKPEIVGRVIASGLLNNKENGFVAHLIVLDPDDTSATTLLTAIELLRRNFPEDADGKIVVHILK